MLHNNSFYGAPTHTAPLSNDAVGLDETPTGSMCINTTVYHRNPVGQNYIFHQQKGTIIGFVNATQKRVMVEWEQGEITSQIKPHNVSSLTCTPPSRKCVKRARKAPASKTKTNNTMLSIKQWQTPCKEQTTRVYKHFASFKCHGCTTHTRPTTASMVSCSRDDTIVQLCSNCWRSAAEDWICTDCHTKPDDSDVFGCQQCGQWAHIGCQLKSSIDNYMCNACTSVMPVVIPQMKVEIYDLRESLKNTRTQLKTKTVQIKQMTIANNASEDVHKDYAQKITTLTSQAQAQTQEMLHLELSNDSLKKRNMELVKATNSCSSSSSSSSSSSKRFPKGECPSCQKVVPMDFYCKDCVDTLLQRELVKNSQKNPILSMNRSPEFKEFKTELTKCKGAAIAITGKKRVFRVQTATDKTREKRKNAAAKRRKKQYAETAKEAKPYFDQWFKEDVTVDKKFKDARTGKEALEEQYVSWHTKKNLPVRLLLSTKAKKEGMHFSTEVLKRINTTLKRKKNNQVTFMDNGASVACFPYIRESRVCEFER